MTENQKKICFTRCPKPNFHIPNIKDGKSYELSGRRSSEEFLVKDKKPKGEGDPGPYRVKNTWSVLTHFN